MRRFLYPLLPIRLKSLELFDELYLIRHRYFLDDPERVLLVDAAQKLGESRETALSILISAASTVGFKTDVKLNRIVDSIRTSF